MHVDGGINIFSPAVKPSYFSARSAAIVRRCNNKAQDICTMFTYSLQVAVASSILNIFRSKAVNILGKR